MSNDTNPQKYGPLVQAIALKWWQQRQIDRRKSWVERLREEPIQELFALRRSLELTSQGDASHLIADHQHYLTSLENLFASLRRLKQSLHPAFVEDSLPLALRQKIEEWEHHNPHIHYKLVMPTVWSFNAPYNSWLILDILDEWLMALGEDSLTIREITFALSERSSEQQLLVAFSTPEQPLAFHNSPLFQILQVVFAELLGGLWLIQEQTEHIVWCFRWPQCACPGANPLVQE